jgi:putative ABC transport system permease protein
MAKSIMKSLNAGFVAFGTLAVLLITTIAVMNHSFDSMLLLDKVRTAEMVRTSDANMITFNDLKRMKKEAGIERISGYSEMVALVSNRAGVRKDGIKLVLIDEDYSLIYKHELLKGGFPDTDSIKRGKAYAVISDQLALGLFMTIDVIGNEIEIMGNKFTVSGVYRGKDSIFWRLSGDGFDRVFIPYTGIDSYMELPVDIVALLKKEDQHISDIKFRIDAITDQKMASYKSYDYMISGVTFHQYFDLLIFIIGLAAISFTIVLLVRYAACMIRRYKEKLKSYYPRDLLKADIKKTTGVFLIFPAGLAGLVLIGNMIRFSFIVPDKYLPEDNIFDMEFYISTAIKDIMMANSYKINVYSAFEYYRRSIACFNIYCVSLICVFIIISTMLYNLLLRSGAKSKSILSAISIIILAGGALGVLMAVLSGFDAYFPIKSWLVVLYYFLVLFVLRKFELSHGPDFMAADLTILK